MVIDNFSNSSKIALDRVTKLSRKDLICVEGDITDREKVRSIFDQHPEISSVVHFAALKAVGESTEFPLQYYQNNVTGSIVLMEEMLQAGVKNLVFSSSCTVYGSRVKSPFLKSFLPELFLARMVELSL